MASRHVTSFYVENLILLKLTKDNSNFAKINEIQDNYYRLECINKV